MARAAALHAPDGSLAEEIVVRHYGVAPGTGRLYRDDGESVAFERGALEWWGLMVTPDGEGGGSLEVDPPAERFVPAPRLAVEFMTHQ